VLLPAQLNSGSGWGSATICDVSARGLSLRSTEVPPRGSIIELRHGDMSIVGQVRWATGGRCGVHTRDRIALSALLGADDPIRDALRGRILPNPLQPAPRRSSAESAARSRLIGQAMEWAAVAAIGALAAGAIAATANATLILPFARVETTLAAPDD
jgi:hypothetical protein